MISDENAFQSYIHLHMHHLCSVVLYCVMHQVFIFTVAILSACLYLRAGAEISSMLDDMVV
jgi:hypothetical protein